MSRGDVFKSLLRSTALSAQESLRNLPITAALKKLLSESALGSAPISDAQLTADVARVAGVTAATVRTDHSAVRVHASFRDGGDVELSLRPAGVKFAAGGAKEVAFTTDPPDAAETGRARDLVSAIGGAVARRLWQTALAGAPHTHAGAPVSSQDGRLYLDLRSVPEVRWALARRLPAAMIEAITLKSISLQPGALLLAISIPALEQLRRG